MSLPTKIADLCDRFRRNHDSYRLPSYNETQLRREFIDPFFTALGWDIDNEEGYAQAYKDVIHEDSIKIGGATKVPDYSFRIGGTRKFFVETKKPAVNIAQDVSPAFQLRRYGWSAKLPLSILTDFEEFAVYDCRLRPEKNDKASKARTLYLKYDEYDERWDEIASIFSRDAVLKGSFDKYAESTKKKRGTAEVDEAFLKEIELWRADLARNLALRNPKLSQRELNFAVQKTIDRIIFLRICEDRGMESYGQLQSLPNGPRVFARLCELFRRADDRYNSGLFHFSREKGRAEATDEWTLSLEVDDRVLKDIIRKLYYPDSPYEFSVLGADILGQVYEQFLGKVIRLTKAHQAKVEDKPEVKKAGGVYYTPTYIVDYIVAQTVGKLLEGKTPHEVAARTKTTWKPSKRGRPLSVLDPACGSGSFLIGAYQYLLDWYRDWYVEHDPAKHKDRIHQTRKDQWRLTTAQRKQILLDHIHGVDIDPQAVEVTKLSLLLKVLEGEDQESLERQMRLFHERALPDLADNIKCGNSLIGPDFYEGRQLNLFDEDERLRINVFDWQAEFPQIIQSGGFDAVIGNPPWGGDIDNITQYLAERYPESTRGYKDSAKIFIDKALTLVANLGLVGFIVPSAMMFQPRWQDVRTLLRRHSIQTMWNVGDRVFGPRVVAPCCVFVVSGQAPEQHHEVQIIDTSSTKDNAERAQLLHATTPRRLQQSVYENTTQNVFVTFYRDFQSGEVPLSQILECKDCGIKHQRVGCGLEEKGKSDLASRLYYEGKREKPSDKPYLIGADLALSGWYIDHSDQRFFRANYQAILRENEIVYFNESVFDLPHKIVWRQTSNRIRAMILGPHWFANTLQAGILLDDAYDLRYVLGLLNSRFLNFIYVENVKESGRVFPQVKLVLQRRVTAICSE